MELDLSSLPRVARGRELLLAFGALVPGTALTLLAEDAAPEALEALQSEHPGQFEWWPLVDGPEAWRILVIRRDRYSDPVRRVLEFMDRDHQRFFQLLLGMLGALEARDFEEARRLFHYFGTGLSKHARMEEEVLLPLVAEKLGSPRGPAMLLRDQHLTLETQLKLLEADLSRSEGAAPDSSIDSLRERLVTVVSVLREHVATEERILYPVVDYLLGAAERDAVVRRCQAML